MPEGYGRAFTLADLTFQHQVVFDNVKMETVHLTPLPDHLMDDDLTYLGKHHTKEIAQMIANGKMDPIKLTPFPESALKLANVQRSFSSPSAVHITKKEPAGGNSMYNNNNKTNRNNNMINIRHSDSAVPTKTITNYFTPVSSSAQKPFKPPIKSVKSNSQEEGASPTETSANTDKSTDTDVGLPSRPNKRRKCESSQIVRSRFFSQSEPIESGQMSHSHETVGNSLTQKKTVITTKDEMDSCFEGVQAHEKPSEPHPSTCTSSAWFESPLVSPSRLSTRKSPNFSRFQMGTSNDKLKSLQGRFSTNRAVTVPSESCSKIHSQDTEQ